MRYVIYDMSICPANFDFLTFCVVAKAQCAAMGEECYVIFKKGPNRGFREPNRKPYSLEEQEFRMGHVLYPICKAMGLNYSTEGTPDIFPNIDESQVLRSKDNPYQLLAILKEHRKGSKLEWPKPTQKALEMVRKEYPVKPIVITLRETYTEGRNSVLYEWMKFYDYICGYNNIVFIRDTAMWNESTASIKDIPVFPVASIDLDIRLALYHYAKMNYSVGGGPSILLHYSTTIPYRTFKMAFDGYKSSSVEFLTQMEFPPGSQWPWATSNQKIIWELDTFENLKKEWGDGPTKNLQTRVKIS